MSTIDLPLPTAGVADNESNSETLRVYVMADGRRFIEAADVSEDTQLRDAAKKATAAHPTVKAVLFADGSVPYRRIIATIDGLRQGGVRKVTFAVASPAAAP